MPKHKAEEGCRFDICSFGSTFKIMFENSVKDTETNIPPALKNIRKPGADLAGTGLLTPLGAACVIKPDLG